MEDLPQARNKGDLAAASVYLSCRLQGYPRLVDEVAELTDTPKDIISKLFGPIARKLQLPLPLMRPSLLIPRFAGKLKLPARETEYCRRVCEELFELSLCERAPQTIACCAIMFICLLCSVRIFTLESLLEACYVSFVPVKEAYTTIYSERTRLRCLNELTVVSALPVAITLAEVRSFFQCVEVKSAGDEDISINTSCSTPTASANGSMTSSDEGSGKKRRKSCLFTATRPLKNQRMLAPRKVVV